MFNSTNYDNLIDLLNNLNELIFDFKLYSIRRFTDASDMLNNQKV